MKKSANLEKFNFTDLKSPLLILVRHGQTDFNLQRRFQGQLDVPLNETGIRQAHQSADAIVKLLESVPQKLINNAHFVSSDLARALDSAVIIRKSIEKKYNRIGKFETTPLLREQHVGDLQGLTLDQFHGEFQAIAKEYDASMERDPNHTRAPGKLAESKFDVAKRIHEQLKSTLFHSALQSKGDLHIWCCHGWVINAMVDLLGIDLGQEAYIGNADVLFLSSKTGHKPESYLAKHFEVSMKLDVIQHLKIGERLGHLSFIKKTA
jgi:broad specificity phosphatase PhoE